MKLRSTFPECCETCEYLGQDENGFIQCQKDSELDLSESHKRLLSICEEYEVSWDMHNQYRNRQGLPALPNNYYPYGPEGWEARWVLKDAFKGCYNPGKLSLQEQLEIFIETNRGE